MTKQEWQPLAALVRGWWPASADRFDANVEASWFLELRLFETGDVERSLRAMLREGSAFAPSLGQVLAKLQDNELAVMPWVEAWALLQRAGGRFGRGRKEDAVAWLADQAGPVVAGFARLEWRAVCDAEVGDPDKGGMIVAQFERRYREFAERVRERGVLELAGGQTGGQLRSLRVPELDSGDAA